MGKAFNKLERHVEQEYKNKPEVLRRVKKEKHLKSLAEADRYIGKATAGKVKREKALA